LVRAYETLKDPTLRERHDESGDGEGSIADALRTTFFQPVTPEELQRFVEEYRGSDQERRHVADFVKRHEGDVTHLFEHIMCSEPTDGDLFMEMIQSLLVDGAVPNELRERVLSSFPQLKRAGDNVAERAAGGQTGFQCQHGRVGGSDSQSTVRSRCSFVEVVGGFGEREVFADARV